MMTLQAGVFGVHNGEVLTRKENIGWVRDNNYNKKFKRPNTILVDGIGTFTFRTSWKADLTGYKFIYESDIFVGNSQSAMKLICW
jgi:hypothetical protein